MLCGLIAFLMVFLKPGIFNNEKKSAELVDKETDEGQKIEKIRLEILEKCINVIIKDKNNKNKNALYLYNSNAKRNIILVHGYRGMPEIDFAEEFKFLQKSDFNILLIRLGTLYPNSGNFITMGLKEKEELVPWVEFFKKENSLPIYIWSQSMGTYSTLSCLDVLQDKVSGVIADCGYTSVYSDFMDTVNRVVHFPPLSFLIVAATGFWVSLIIHKSIFSHSTVEKVKDNNIPTLFVHGDSDTLVDKKHTLKNYENNKGKKDLLLVKNANHLASFNVSQEEYIQKLKTFFGW